MLHNRDRMDMTYALLEYLHEQQKPISFQRLMYWTRMPYYSHKPFVEELSRAGLLQIIPFDKSLAKSNSILVSQFNMNTKRLVVLTNKGEKALDTLKKMRELNPDKHVKV